MPAMRLGNHRKRILSLSVSEDENYAISASEDSLRFLLLL